MNNNFFYEDDYYRQVALTEGFAKDFGPKKGVDPAKIDPTMSAEDTMNIGSPDSFDQIYSQQRTVQPGETSIPSGARPETPQRMTRMAPQVAPESAQPQTPMGIAQEKLAGRVDKHLPKFPMTGDPETDSMKHGGMAAHTMEQINAMTQKHGDMDPKFRQSLINDHRAKLNDAFGKEAVDRSFDHVYGGHITQPFGGENVINKSLVKSFHDQVALFEANELLMKELFNTLPSRG